MTLPAPQRASAESGPRARLLTLTSARHIESTGVGCSPEG